MKKLLAYAATIGGICYIGGALLSGLFLLLGKPVASDACYSYVSMPGLALGVAGLFMGTLREDFARQDLQLRSKLTGNTIMMPAHYEPEAVDKLLTFFDEEDKERAFRAMQWPDEAYTAPDILTLRTAKHYHTLVHLLEQQLGPFVGALAAPHGLVCQECAARGHCTCDAPWMWLETPEELIARVQQKLQSFTHPGP